MNKTSSKNKFIIFILMIIGVIFCVYYFELYKTLTPEMIQYKLNQLGNWGPIAYILGYAIATVLFVPGSAITIAGGAIFGALFGTFYVIIGATIGATLAFLISRYMGGEFFQNLLKTKFKKLNDLDSKFASHGLSIMFILRLIPLFPFNGLNYSLGLTKVKFKDYFIGTLFGIIPGTFAFTYFGSSLATLNPIKISIAVGLLIALTVGVSYIKKNSSLAQSIEEKPTNSDKEETKQDSNKIL